MTFTLLGIFFDIDGSNIYRILTQLESFLVKKLHIEKDPTLTEESFKQFLKSGNNIYSDKIQPHEKILVVDTTTVKFQRPSKSPNQFYSGKHKMFAVKFEMLTDLDGKIVKISNLYSGQEHDFKIRMNESSTYYFNLRLRVFRL